MIRNVLLAAALSLSTLTAPAQTTDGKNSRERDALRRTQQALRDAEARGTELERQAAEAAAKVKEAGNRSNTLGNKLAVSERRTKALQDQVADVEAQLEASRKTNAAEVARVEEANRRIEALNAQLAAAQRETDAKSQVAKTEIDRLQASVASSRRAEGECEAKNLALYEYGRSLLDRYNRKGVKDALLQRDPFVGLKQVEIDNLLQEYRDKLDTAKLTPQAAQRQ